MHISCSIQGLLNYIAVMVGLGIKYNNNIQSIKLEHLLWYNQGYRYHRTVDISVSYRGMHIRSNKPPLIYIQSSLSFVAISRRRKRDGRTKWFRNRLVTLRRLRLIASSIRVEYWAFTIRVQNCSMFMFIHA